MGLIQLSDNQKDAIRRLKIGSILDGGVGSGKTRTALGFYYKLQGGNVFTEKYIKMKNPKDLYIITTAYKRDTLDWEKEMTMFLIGSELYSHKVVVDSWNNIKKYKDVKDAFFIFDEQRLVGYGTWSRTFLKIAKSNEWILATATPGDKWEEYLTVFMANDFYRTKYEFEDEHIVYKPFRKFKQVHKYINTQRLEALRASILVRLEVDRHTIRHNKTIVVPYDKALYDDVMKNRWNPYKDFPIESASELCYLLRRISNIHPARLEEVKEMALKANRVIVFYNFNYELDDLRTLKDDFAFLEFEIAEWNGHNHEPCPTSDKWIYLVQYTAGCEGWNCITTDTMIFYSRNYSYKVMEQASGRIDRMNTPYTDLYYYHLTSDSKIDKGIKRAIDNKKKFNEVKFLNFDVKKYA